MAGGSFSWEKSQRAMSRVFKLAVRHASTFDINSARLVSFNIVFPQEIKYQQKIIYPNKTSIVLIQILLQYMYKYKIQAIRTITIKI